MSDDQAFAKAHEGKHAVLKLGRSRRLPFALGVALLLSTVVLTGCGPRDASYDPTHFRVLGYFVPPDVVAPGKIRESTVIGGLYVGSAKTGCCLVSPTTALLIRKRASGTTLRAGIYIPSVQTFRMHHQTLSVRIPQIHFTSRPQTLSLGNNDVLFHLPPQIGIAKGNILVQLLFSVDYVPKAAGDGSDTRHLAAVLYSMYFE